MRKALLVVALTACAPAASSQSLPLTAAVVHGRGAGFDASHEQALRVYGQARQLELEGRCDEARRAYESYAELVHASDPESAKLAISYARSCPPRAHVDETLSAAFGAILANAPARALSLLDADPRESPWRDYARGVALADLRRTNDAAEAFDAAARSFGRDVHGRSIAIYGKARAYHDMRRCVQATAAYEEYAALVRVARPEDAAAALRYARDCPIP
jgi:tetratricopeptide (TPR) repeat protein